jgi:Trp operon repressor
MVSKNKKKPKKIKYVGGDFFGVMMDSLMKEDKIKEWNNFIDTLMKSFNNKEEDPASEPNISEEEANEILKKFFDKIVIVENKSGEFRRSKFIRKGSDEGSDYKGSDDEVEKTSCAIKDDQKDILKLYEKFDIIFVNILNIINDYIGTPPKKNDIDAKLQGFQKTIKVLKFLPNINNNLPKIANSNITTLSERLNVIVNLLQTDCSSFKAFLCSSAVTFISNTIDKDDKKIKKLYEDLIKVTHEITCDDTLITTFIKDVIPIMIKNLNGIQEFKKEIQELEKLKEEYSSIFVGGKKFSRAVRKEIQGKHKDIGAKTSHKPVMIAKKIILGKERCIYKIQGSKSEHVKHKGSIITVTDYKKLMKIL